MPQYTDDILKRKRIAFVLGSRRPVPPTSNANTISWLLYSMEQHLAHLDIRVISQWDPALQKMDIDRNRYLHVTPSTLPRWLTLLLRYMPYRVRKQLTGTGSIEWSMYYLGQAWLLRKVRPDIIVTHVHWPAFKLAVLACPHAKHIFYFHSSNLGDWPKDWISYILRHADGLVTLCRAALDSLEQRYGQPPFPTRVIYNGVNLDLFNPQLRQEKRGTARAKYGLKEDDIVVLYAGRINRAKGLDLILDAFLQAQQHVPHLKLVVAGDEKFERAPDLEFARDFRERVRSCCNTSVQMVGWIPYEKLIEMYALADIGVLASKEIEGNPMFLLESMACGVPVISTAVGGVPEIVKNGVTGILVSPDNAQAGMVQALVTLASNHDLRQEMGRQAVEHVRVNHSSERMAQELASFMTEVLNYANMR